MDDLCSLYPLMDVHFGMQAWGRETGETNYDMKTAAGDMSYAFDKLDARTPASKQAVLVIGGDFFMPMITARKPRRASISWT